MKSELLKSIPNISAEFFDGSPDKKNPLFNSFLNHHPIYKQVHGIRIGEVTDTNKNCGNVDGLYTKIRGQPIGVITADCLPLLLAKKDGQKIAAIHAGWRGLFSGILNEFKLFLEEKNESPKDWVVSIGPSIQACCYEVDETLIKDFLLKFPDHPSSLISPTHRKLNLSHLAKAECEKMGFYKVERLPDCTHCHKNRDGTFKYPSFRREKTTLRSHSLIEIMS